MKCFRFNTARVVVDLKVVDGWFSSPHCNSAYSSSSPPPPPSDSALCSGSLLGNPHVDLENVVTTGVAGVDRLPGLHQTILDKSRWSRLYRQKKNTRDSGQVELLLPTRSVENGQRSLRNLRDVSTKKLVQVETDRVVVSHAFSNAFRTTENVTLCGSSERAKKNFESRRTSFLTFRSDWLISVEKTSPNWKQT